MSTRVGKGSDAADDCTEQARLRTEYFFLSRHMLCFSTFFSWREKQSSSHSSLSLRYASWVD